MAVPSVIGYTYFVNVVDRVHGYRLSHEDASILKKLVLNKKFGESSRQVYFYYPNDQASNILASNISRVGYYNYGCQTAITDAAYGDAKSYVAAMKSCSEVDSITIVTSTEGHSLFTEALRNNNINASDVKFILTR